MRELRSAAVVLAHLALFNVPGVIFFFLWLFHWGHGSDLQNAAVLPMVSLSLTFGFVGWLFRNHESKVR